MNWVFQPPPGWPVPPGWQPPLGWHPDPTWPLAPAGWQFWVPAPPTPPPPAYGAPAPPQPPPPWHQRWWAVGGALLSVLLAGCVLGGALAVVTDPGEGSSEAPPAAAPPPPGSAPGGENPGGENPGGESPGDENPGESDALGPGQERTGSGPAIIAIELPTDSLHLVTLTHTGDGVFHSRLLGQNGEFGRSLGGGVGEFTGVYPLELRNFGAPGAIDIVDASGGWTVAIQPISEAPLWPEQTTGAGPGVLRVDPDTDVSTVAVAHEGTANIIIWGHVSGEYEDLMVNEIGEWSGEVTLRPDTIVLEVEADGAWTIDPA